MRKLFKKALACCLVAALALTCFVGALSVNAETYAGTIVAGEIEVAADATTAVVPVVINADAALNAAKITVAAEGWTVSSIAVDAASTAAKIDAENINGATFLIEALVNNDGFTTATVNVTLTAEAAVAAKVAITLDEVHAATWNEDVVNLEVTDGAITVKAAEPEVGTFDASFRYIVTVDKAVGVSMVFTKPADYDDFVIRVNRTTFTNKYAFTPAEELVLTPADAYLTSGNMYGFKYFELGLYELSMDVTLSVEGYKDGKLVDVSNDVTLNIADEIVNNMATASDKNKKIYSEIIWLSDAALKYFQYAAGAADIDTVESPAANVTTTPIEGYTPVEDVSTDNPGTASFYMKRIVMGAAPSIQFMMNGITDTIRADGIFTADHISGLASVGAVSISAPLATATDNMMIAGAANAYLHDEIALYDADKLITVKVLDGEGNELASSTTSLAIEVSKALTTATETNIVNLYKRLLTFGEVAKEYFGS